MLDARHAAAVLLGEGDRPDAFDAPRVAIVGTRAATPMGIADAKAIGGFCARAGITVVSGLAIGIDGAAHQGALDAGGLTVGVVATGLDVVYPRRHARLYEQVREQGLIVGENDYGTQPLPWRFPIRNRIIAALADAVVVVEATIYGRRPHHRERRGPLRPRRVRAAGLAPEPGRGRMQRAAARRRQAAARTVRRAVRDRVAAERCEGGWAAPPPPADPDQRAVLRRWPATPRRSTRSNDASRSPPPGSAPALRALELGGHLERKRGLWWPAEAHSSGPQRDDAQRYRRRRGQLHRDLARTPPGSCRARAVGGPSSGPTGGPTP